MNATAFHTGAPVRGELTYKIECVDPDQELAQATGDLLLAVMEGVFDADLQLLFTAVTERQRVLQGSFRQRSRELAPTFKKGDHVRIRHDADLRPRYILGCTGVVEKVNQSTVVIRWDPNQYLGRFARTPTCRVPAAGLEHIEEGGR